MKVIILTIVAVILLGAVGYQYWKYTHYAISCEGDFSYNVKCPLGTYCKSLNEGPMAGGICRPYTYIIFNP